MDLSGTTDSEEVNNVVVRNDIDIICTVVVS